MIRRWCCRKTPRMWWMRSWMPRVNCGRSCHCLRRLKNNTRCKAIVAGSLFESGGRSVNRSVSRTLWPADVLVGVRPLFDDAEGANPNANAGFELMRYGYGDGKVYKPWQGPEGEFGARAADYHWTHDDSSGWNYDFTSPLHKAI